VDAGTDARFDAGFDAGLHDLKRWEEAVAAYEAVPLETFKGHRAWLVDVVQEALAYVGLTLAIATGPWPTSTSS